MCRISPRTRFSGSQGLKTPKIGFFGVLRGFVLRLVPLAPSIGAGPCVFLELKPPLMALRARALWAPYGPYGPRALMPPYGLYGPMGPRALGLLMVLMALGVLTP